MANWFHRFLNPHCPECKLDSQDKRVCQSCETLKTEVARLTADNERILNTLIEKKGLENFQPEKTPVMLRPPSAIPWNVRRQMLEREDRERAKILKNAPKAETTDVSDLERELNIAEETRDGK